MVCEWQWLEQYYKGSLVWVEMAIIVLQRLAATYQSSILTLAHSIHPYECTGQGVGIESATSFCIIFPAQPGNGINTNYIAETEKSAVSDCTSQVPVGAKPAKSLPSGFIKSAHMISNEYYSQVTGTYDPSKYGLNPNDDGTQYDDSLASQGGVLPDSGCAGFQGYLEYFGGGTFCIRCCNYAFSYYCNPSLDTRGCRAGMLLFLSMYVLTLVIPSI